MDAVVKHLVQQVYPDAPELPEQVMAVIERYKSQIKEHRARFKEGDEQPPEATESEFPLQNGDAILITYGDTFRGDATPLDTLIRFLDEETDGTISGVHVLPFSPYSSDDGFSVIDYRKVNPELGDWDQLKRLAAEYRFMADLVLNHCSAQSDWFQWFLKQEPPYDRYFIVVEPGTDLSAVVRPRALPLTHPFETSTGEQLVWTTFSADQVDLNFAEPAVLLEMLDVFLGYLGAGAQVVRLDAIAYLWKEIGHSCIHHPNTHRVVKLFRRAMDLTDPDAILITETNVPHEENISYFGDGDEAHMVYQFSLPPLLLDAVLRGDASHLQTWAAALRDPGPKASYFNFCASHDGIGLLPTHGILTDDERSSMIETVQNRGGRVSYKATPSGDIPYELNINYLSAVADPNLPAPQRARVFLATQAVMLALAGVPGIYVHSLIGSENWKEGVEATGINRTVNREKLEYAPVVDELHNQDSLRYHVFEGYKSMLAARAEQPAFHPKAPQRVVQTIPALFVVIRGPIGDSGHQVLCIHNLSDGIAELQLKRGEIEWPPEGVFRDLISGDIVYPTPEGDYFSLEMQPYEVMWLRN